MRKNDPEDISRHRRVLPYDLPVRAPEEMCTNRKCVRTENVCEQEICTNRKSVRALMGIQANKSGREFRVKME